MKKAFASETAFKIYSVLIAIFLWAFVVYNQNPQSTKVVNDVQISCTNLSELERAGLTIKKEGRIPTVDVTVKGRRLSIGKIDSSNVSATISVPYIREGVYEVSVETRLPISDVSISDKNPYTINVVVEKLKTVNIPVEVKYTGNPKDEKTTVQAVASPQTISVWGPVSAIDTVSNAVVTVDVSDASDGQTQNMKYKIISKDGKDITNDVNINADTDTISVVSSIYKTKDIPIELGYVSNIMSDYVVSSVEILPGSVRLGSKDESVYSIEKIMTEPIDMSNVTQGGKLALKLIIPEGFVNVFDISQVEVSIGIEQKVSKTISIESVSFQNVQNGKKYEATSLPVSITLQGAKNLIESFEPMPTVDVSSLGEGTHVLALNLHLPEGVLAIGEESIAVIVSAKE